MCPLSNSIFLLGNALVLLLEYAEGNKLVQFHFFLKMYLFFLHF